MIYTIGALDVFGIKGRGKVEFGRCGGRGGKVDSSVGASRRS